MNRWLSHYPLMETPIDKSVLVNCQTIFGWDFLWKPIHFGGTYKIGVPSVLIHFSGMFHENNNIFWGISPFVETPNGNPNFTYWNMMKSHSIPLKMVKSNPILMDVPFIIPFISLFSHWTQWFSIVTSFLPLRHFCASPERLEELGRVGGLVMRSGKWWLFGDL